MLFLPLSLYAAVLPGYDFTFFKTITDSLMAADSEKLGIDLTGYGFIGSTITSGIYLRFGIQSPYTTIWSLFKNGKTDSQEEIDILSQAKSHLRTQIEANPMNTGYR